MASLVNWLAYAGARTVTGVPVATGRAYFYQPGTTNTQVPVYSDADGLVVATQPVTLDASGRAVVYAKVPVRVEVQNSVGAVIRLSDRANTINSKQVEIELAGYVGTSLVTGLQVDGGRTDLSTVLSLAGSSTGAPGFQYLESVGATARSLVSAIGLWVTPQDFGALGNDSADDTIPLQAAITRCIASGKALFLTPGTYRITSPLTVTGVGLRIFGVKGAAIKNMSTTGNAITVNVGSAIESSIAFDGFYVVANTTSSGAAILFTNGNGAAMTRVTTTGHRIGFDMSAVSFAHLEDCLVTSTDSNAAGKGFRMGPSSTAYRCRATQTNGSGFALEGAGSRAINCRAAVTTGTGFSLTGAVSTVSTSAASGCTTGYSFGANDTSASMSQATTCTTGFTVGAFARCGATLCTSTDATSDFTTNVSSTLVIDQSNTFTIRTQGEVAGNAGMGTRGRVVARNRTTSAAGVTWTPDPKYGELQVLVNTGTGGPAYTIGATATGGLIDGQKLIFVLENAQNTAAASLVWNVQYVPTGPALPLAWQRPAGGNNALFFEFIWRASTTAWVLFNSWATSSTTYVW